MREPDNREAELRIKERQDGRYGARLERKRWILEQKNGGLSMKDVCLKKKKVCLIHDKIKLFKKKKRKAIINSRKQTQIKQ